MTIEKVINDRRTIHSFKDEEISEELVNKALELALTAPNHRHTFPWKFIEIGKQTRPELIKIGLNNINSKKGPASSEEEQQAREAKLKVKLQHPAAIVAFVLKKSDDAFVEREDYASVSCGIQNFTLFLKSHGWDSKWSTGAITSCDATYKLLKVDSKVDEIVGFVMVGHSPVDLPARRRPHLSEVLTKLP